MGGLRDGEFSRWEVHEIGVEEIGSSADGELRIWGVKEMGSARDGEFSRWRVHEIES